MNNFYKIASCPITYYVDKENRVVVAMMHHTERLALNYLMKRSIKGKCKEGVCIIPLLLDCEGNYGYLAMNDKYSARVFCHPEDNFDPEEGKRLAKKKLMKNVYKAFSNRLRRYVKQMEEYGTGILAELDAFGKDNDAQ